MNPISKTDNRALSSAEKKTVVATALAVVRAAFPVQNFTREKAESINNLWMITFANVESDILREAVLDFVSKDTKGFFPSPGQIMKSVEDVRRRRYWASIERRERELLMREYGGKQ